MAWRLFSPAPKALRTSFNERYPKWMSLRPETLRAAAAAENAMLIPMALRQRADHEALILPVVIVAGEQDRLVMSKWHSKRLRKRLPNSRLHLIPGAGHMVHHAAPDAVFQAIREVSSLVIVSTPADIAPPSRISPEDEPLRQHAV